jgi:hypothetical protein
VVVTQPTAAAQVPATSPPPRTAPEGLAGVAPPSDAPAPVVVTQPTAPPPTAAAQVPATSPPPRTAPEGLAGVARPPSSADTGSPLYHPAVQPAAQAGSAASPNAGEHLGAVPKLPSTSSGPLRFAPPDARLLLSRGDELLALGDISAARLLYERAAAAGSARAATALGKTYDPAFLASTQARGITPDRAAAASWYRKGAALGDAEAVDRLARLAPAQ